MSAGAMGPSAHSAGALLHGVVHAGGVATQYVRSGQGEVVVFLVQGLERADVLQTVHVLARNFLVLAAAPPSGDTVTLTSWLRTFLECLGVPDAHVLLQAPASILTGEFPDA